MSHQDKNPLGTILTYAVGTVVVSLSGALLIQYFLGKAEERAARMASGESRYERKHPHKA